jgi:cytochrome c
MDKMTINMIAGAVLSSLLVIFGTSTFVNILYPRGGTPEHDEAQVADAHGGKAGAPAATEPAAPATPLPVLLAKASVDAGAAQAKKCAACHSFEKGGPNKVGPDLFDVVGRPVASHEGFAYSPALKAFGGNWDYEKLNCFIHSPKDCVPGTKMTFAGIKKDSDRADVIAYLHSISPDAPPLPTAEKAAEAPAEKPAAAAPTDQAAPAPAGGAPAKPAAPPANSAAEPAKPSAPATAGTAPAAAPAQSQAPDQKATTAPNAATPPAQPPAETAAPAGGDTKPPVEANANEGGTPAPTEPKPAQN